MANVNPLLLVGAVIGVVTALLVFAYASVKDKKGSMGFERNMADGEIVRRLIQLFLSPSGPHLFHHASPFLSCFRRN